MNESLIVGLVLFVFVSAVAYYLMMRLAYVEKKMGLMEAVLIDIKVALESIEHEQDHTPPPALPASAALGSSGSSGSGSSSSRSGNAVEEASEGSEGSEEDEKFYSSVLEQVHEDAAEGGLEKASEELTVTEEPAAAATATSKVGPNYDGMTRSELVALAEQRGLRVPKRLSRGEVISLLRGSEGSRNDSTSTGTDNASGPTGSTFATASPVDGGFQVDLGQGIVSEEVNL